MSASDALSVRDVSFCYREEDVVRSASLAVRPGESVALMGPSGCGKSTLLLLAGGVLVPREGEIILGGHELSALSARERSAVRRHHVGIVFQFGELISELSLLDNVALAAELAGTPRRKAVRRARELLERVGIGDLASRKPGEVSGGQGQRCAVARALVHGPSIVLADEPTGALDQATARNVLGLLIEVVQESGAALLMATHDPDVASRCGRLLMAQDGQLAVA